MHFGVFDLPTDFAWKVKQMKINHAEGKIGNSIDIKYSNFQMKCRWGMHIILFLSQTNFYICTFLMNFRLTLIPTDRRGQSSIIR